MATGNTGEGGHSDGSNSHFYQYLIFQDRGAFQMHFVREQQEADDAIRAVVSREYGIREETIKLELKLRPMDFDPSTNSWKLGLEGFYDKIMRLPKRIYVPILFIYIPNTTITPHQTKRQRRRALQRQDEARDMTFKFLKGDRIYTSGDEIPGIPFDQRRDLFHCPFAIQWAGANKYVTDVKRPRYIYLPSPDKRDPTYEQYQLPGTRHQSPATEDQQLKAWKQKWEVSLGHREGYIDDMINQVFGTQFQQRLQEANYLEVRQ